MKRLLIIFFILIISSCNKREYNLKEHFDSKQEFKISFPSDWNLDKEINDIESSIKFKDSSLTFKISGFNKDFELDSTFYDSLIEMNKKNVLLRTKSDYYKLNGFQVYEQYAMGKDTLIIDDSYNRFSRIDYWLKKKNDKYYLWITVQKKDTIFVDKDYDLMETILKSIEREKLDKQIFD